MQLGGGTSQQIAACTATASTATSTGTALGTAFTTYGTLSASIITTGYVCTAATVASAAADLAISKNMSGDISEGYMGAIGAAPALIGGVVMLANGSTGQVSHNAAGISSCVTPGLGATLTVNKLAAVCKQSMMSHADRFSCAKTADPAIARMERDEPGRIQGLFSEAQKLFGAEALQNVLATPFNPGLLASLIAKDDPSIESGLKAYLETVPAKVSQKGLPQTILGSAPPAQQHAQPVRTLSAANSGTDNAVGAPSLSDRSPASVDEAPAAAAANMGPDKQGLYPTTTSLFDIVSKRYQIVKDRVEKSSYTLPYNKFTTTN